MKKAFIAGLILFSSSSIAWFNPGPIPWTGGWAGPAYNMVWGGYGMPYGYMGIPQPSFNYTTTIIQTPVIIREQPPQIIYKESCNEECERLRGYFNKNR